MSFLGYILFFAVMVFAAKDANAYLDPGTGSFIFQLLIGGALGGIVAIKLKFKQFKNLFLGSKKAKKSAKNSNDTQN